MPRPSDPGERLNRLWEVLTGAQSMLIVMQDSPDPDAIAAAAALRELAHTHDGIRCTLGSAGAASRAENVALLRYLELRTRPLSEVDPDRFDRLAMVDAQPGGNVNLPADLRFDIVIDHHPIRRETRAARLTDVRKHYGATSSILYEYLAAAEVEINTQLATALLYGIRTDTQDLGRETTRADIDAYLALAPKANVRSLARIMTPPLPRSYFAELRQALDRATLYDDRLVTVLEDLESPDMIAETADLLLRAEGVRYVMCLGWVSGDLHLSFRLAAADPGGAELAWQVVEGLGHGGGHQTLAGAQVPVDDETKDDPQKRQALVDEIIERFLKATGAPSDSPEPLCKR